MQNASSSDSLLSILNEYMDLLHMLGVASMMEVILSMIKCFEQKISFASAIVVNFEALNIMNGSME